MDSIYEGLFATLYETQSTARMRDGRELGFTDAVRRVIDSATDGIQRNTNVRVRPDAKYFLLVNFVEMLLAPLLLAQREPPELLFEAAAHDIELLIRGAAFAGSPLNSEVSAHRLIDTLSRNWTQLKLSDIHIWDGNA